jgi:hypothetical protein
MIQTTGGGRVGLGSTFGALVLALLGLAGAAHAAEPPNLRLLTPPGGSSPTPVEIGLYDLQIVSISEQDQVFRVVGRMDLTWLDPRQAYEPAAVGTEILEYQGQSALDHLDEDVWWPDLEFTDAVGARERLSVNLSIFADGTVWYRERFDVQIKQDFYLEDFPFDAHVISFHVEPFTYGGSALELVAAEQEGNLVGWEPSEWVVGDAAVEVQSGAEGGFPGITVSMPIGRVASHYTGNVILPMILILLACGAVFFMDLDATHLGDRLGLAFTGLLTVVAFDFVASDSLPKLWYSTALDRVITTSYVFMTLAIALLVLFDRWHLSGEAGARRAARFTHLARWLFPAAYLVTMAILILGAQ